MSNRFTAQIAKFFSSESWVDFLLKLANKSEVILTVITAFISPDDWLNLHDLSIDVLPSWKACSNCWICKFQPSESRFLTIISVFKYLKNKMKLFTNLVAEKNMILLCYFTLSLLSQPWKLNFQLTFFYHIIPRLVFCIESIRTIALSTVILFLKHKICCVIFQQFFNDRMIPINIWKSNTTSIQIKVP